MAKNTYFVVLGEGITNAASQGIITGISGGDIVAFPLLGLFKYRKEGK